MSALGRSIQRKDGMAKVTGRAQYVNDIELPDLVYAAMVRAPVAHATITGIDVATAAATPGVLAVVTAGDLRALDIRFGPFLRDQPALAQGKVRYEGEPVAAVVAVGARSATHAAALVNVGYDQLPCVVDVPTALAPGAPVLHEAEPPRGRLGRALAVEAARNVCARVVLEGGDVDTALARADVVVERTYTFPGVFHYTLEPHAAMAHVEADGMTVWTNTGHPYQLRHEMAEMFGLPLGRVRVVVPYVGGSFGGKSFPKLEPLACLLSSTVRRPVRILNGVEGSMRTARRRGGHCTLALGVSRDGRILAKRCRLLLDGGAYADTGPLVAQKAAVRVLGPYRVEAYHIEVIRAYTNTTPAGSFRSIGAPQGVWASESIMDEAAEAIGWDALKFRHKNLLRRGGVVHSPLRGVDADLPGDLERLSAALDEASARMPAASLTGRGVACALANPGDLPITTALVRLHYDGSVTVMSSTCEVGQGLQTVLAQIAAEEFRILPEAVTVTLPDTALTPYDWSSKATRGTTIVGSAVQRAVRDIIAQLRELAADVTRVPADSVTWWDGAIIAGDRVFAPGEVIRAWFGRDAGEVLGRAYVRELGASPPFWEVAMGGADVAVDRDTGLARLRAYASLVDVGRAINPQQVEAQDLGAVVQGIGHTLFEEMLWSDAGSFRNPSLIEYRVPLATDIPPVMDAVIIENGDGPGPFGAKGMSEGGLVPVAPAVAGAIYRATGVRIRDLPLSPERVWRALRDARR
jgi:CO/xanthine dehydrogenase Mo-binding subunit